MFQKIVNYIARTGLISSGVIEPIFSYYTDNVEMIDQIIDAVGNFDVEFLDVSGEVFVSQNCLIGDNHFKVVILCINDTIADRIKGIVFR